MNRLKKLGPQIALGVTSLIVLYWYLPEIRLASLAYNDGVNHLAIIRMMDQVWARGGNITDFWMGHINFGQALLRSYQFLMHLIIWVMHKTVFAGLTLERCFNLCVAFAAMAMPWSFYKGARLLGFSRLEATIAGVVSVLPHEAEGYGISLTNFTFSGFGTYNELFAIAALPLCIGYVHRLLRTGRSTIKASLAYAFVFMCHILTGYFAALWIGIDAIAAVIENRARAKQIALSLLTFAGLCLLWTAHWFIPMVQDNILQPQSIYESAFKWSGLGAETMLQNWFTGRLLDADRIAILTGLSGLGLLFCLWRRRTLAIQTLLWILLSFGTATWGAALTILPFSRHLHWHRAFAVTQVALLFCAALGLGSFLKWVIASATSTQSRYVNTAAAALLCGTMLYPCLKERDTYFHYTNSHWLEDTVQHWDNNSPGYHKAFEFAQTHNDARYYAGRQSTWGNKLLVTSYIPFYGVLSQFNIENIGSIYHHQSYPEVLAFESDWQNQAQNELMNVRYIMTPADTVAPKGFIPVVQDSKFTLYDNGNREGYFAIGQNAPGGCADGDILVRSMKYFLRSPLLERHIYPQVILSKHCQGQIELDSAIAKAEQMPDTKPPGQVLESGRAPSRSSDRFWAKVHLNEPGLVLFKMTYHPNWRATVDGRPTPTHMAVPAFVAVDLAAGDHTVEFEYQPDTLKRSLEWLCMILWFGALVLLLQKKIRARINS